MRITFVAPPAIEGRAPERLFGCNMGIFFQQNIFVLYPAAVLEKLGHEVIVLDCPTNKINKKQFEEIIKNDNSDFYVFYTVFLAEQIDKQAHNLIRKHKPDTKIIFMGPEPTSKPNDFILDKNTIVIRGEPELTVAELVSKKEYEKIRGMSFLEKGEKKHNANRKIMSNEELDKLPLPSRHLISRDEYFNPKLKGRPTTVMLTSRGCFGRCTYCIPCSYMFAREIDYKRYCKTKPMVALRSPENILKELKEIKKDGYNSIAVIDDNFINGKERTIEICKAFKEVGIEWGCLARASLLQDEELIKAMKDSGCVYVDIGVESFNQKILDYVNKDTTVEQQINAVKLLQKNGIEPKINILFGTAPFETLGDIENTMKILKELDVDFVSFGIIIPHPQTETYQEFKKQGWFKTKSKDYEPVDPYKKSIVDLPNKIDYQKVIRKCYRRYYLRPHYILKRMKKIKSFKEFVENAKSAKNLFT